MKYRLINIGRGKVCREVTVRNERALYNEVSKHLMSKCVELITDDKGQSYRVYAGVRLVGTVERLES